MTDRNTSTDSPEKRAAELLQQGLSAPEWLSGLVQVQQLHTLKKNSDAV
jgi:hypothetical protein